MTRLTNFITNAPIWLVIAVTVATALTLAGIVAVCVCYACGL